MGPAARAARPRRDLRVVRGRVGGSDAAGVAHRRGDGPVVLWVDEIEKGFAPGQHSGDGGTSMRVLGSFLRWLQERRDGVFLVATCNDIGSLPPGLLRRGRFDETFFVDLPHAPERAEILALQLRERERNDSAFDLDGLAARTEGPGAELEGVVVAALYQDFADRAELTTDRIEVEALSTTPLARSRADEIATMRAWADGRAVFAGAAPHRLDADP
ncbi:MAG: AAA family ATPase [Actinomycetota bacterium]